MQNTYSVAFENFYVEPGKSFSLKNYPTDFKNKHIRKEEGTELLQEGIKDLALMQDKLYAHDAYSILIIFQAMDTAGKDGAVKHIMSGLNPAGVKVASFKSPSANELDHDYFWRHYAALPARGEIGIFNRSHYENVLITKVHPEYILNEKLPGIKQVEDITNSFWEKRYQQINRFEKNLNENGTVVLKFFLHVSKEEQKKRLLERIDNPEKNWKFSLGDVKERRLWDTYQAAYEEAISKTSTEYAPWYVVPADDKWYTRLIIASVICKEVEKLNLKYPEVSSEQKMALQKAKEELLYD